MRPIPVPSEGALRILRHLALGTSCTAAFTLGLVLEDRRRLICAAQNLRNNSQKLKSSKRYTTAGASVRKAFEDRALGIHESDTVENGRNLDSLPIIEKQHADLSRVIEVETISRTKLRYPAGFTIPQPQISLFLPYKFSCVSTRKAYGNYKRSSSENEYEFRQNSYISKVEKCISSLLDASPPRIDDAEPLFIRTFSENMSYDQDNLVITEVRLLSLALTLFRACKKESKLEQCQRIFQTVLNWGIEKSTAIPLQLESIIKRFLGRKMPISLENAVFIYLIIIKSRNTISPPLITLGYDLCEKTFKEGQFQCTREIFRHIKNDCEEFSHTSLCHILVSLSKQEIYDPEVFEYFVKYYMQTDFNEALHNKVIKILIDYFLLHRKYYEAEKVIMIVALMAEKNKIQTSAIPCLNLLLNDWETFHDIDRMVALFKRVESYVQKAKCPWLFYELMVKICIEVEDETHARSYYEISREKYGVRGGAMLAQFTLLKAKQGDYEGVINDFKITDKKDFDEYSKLFPNILKEFSNNSSVSQTQNFIELAFNLGVRLTLNTLNKVAQIYARDKDFEAIASLVEYGTKTGHGLDSTFINMILKQASTQWRYKAEDVLNLLETIVMLSPTRQIVDNNTFFFLRGMIVSKKGISESWKFKMLDRLEEIFKSFKLKPRDPYNPKQILGEMALSLNNNDPGEALAIYKWACSNQVLMGSEHLNIAVEASFRCNSGNTEDAVQMIHKSGLSGPQTATSTSLLFVHQLQQISDKREHTADEIMRLSLQFISAFVKRGLKVPTQVVTQTMSALQRLGNYKAVSEFWKLVASRLGLTTSDLDITTLTVFMNTCIGLRDIAGFWHIFNLMAQNNIIPDQHFSLMLENARRSIRRGIMSRRLSKKVNIEFLDTLIKGRALVTRIRAEARTRRNVGVNHLIQKISENYKATLSTK